MSAIPGKAWHSVWHGIMCKHGIMRKMCHIGFVALTAMTFTAPALAQAVKTQRPSAAPAANVGNPTGREVDDAYGAYQRGFFLTAFAAATKRAGENDAAAMTLLGELYTQGLGVGRDLGKAAEWYKLAADRGDTNAIFALAIFHLEGRAGPSNSAEGVRLLTEAAKRGHVSASYNLGLLYFQGQQVGQDFKRAADLFTAAAAAGNPEAQYALATMYKDGRAVPKDVVKAMSLMKAASLAGHVEAMVEYAIGEFNGTGTPKNEAAAAQLFLKAAQRGHAIAQNRLARLLMTGRGLAANPTEAIKWHMIAKAGGVSDPELDLSASKQSADIRDAAENAAKKWMSTLSTTRS